MPLTVKMHLDQLTCIAEDDESGASEPYMFVTYFWVDGRNISAPQPVSTMTPVYDGYRTEMPNGVRAGTVLSVPPFLGNAQFEVDPGPLNFMLAGAIVLLWEEDQTPLQAVLAGRNAYMSGIHDELNELVKSRIQSLDTSSVTPAEADALAEALRPIVKDAIASRLSIWQKLFDDQDDLIGYTYVAFTGDGIRTRGLEFPAIPVDGGANQYGLTGRMAVEPTRPQPVFDRCARPRQALRTLEDQIDGLQQIRQSLQLQLQTAPTSHKAVLVQRITDLAAQITALEAELPALRAALTACEQRFGGVVVDFDDIVVHG